MTTDLPKNEVDHLLVTEEQGERIRRAILSTYFRDKDEKYLQSTYGKIDVEANVNQRYLRSLQQVIPWVSRHIDLKGKNVLEIGCGTGSSTAAFSHFVNCVFAFDIDKKSIEAAQQRMDILGKDNAEFSLVAPEGLVDTISKKFLNTSIDVVLFFAVLEHMAISERHAIIKVCWDLLPDTGIMVVVETPNLLSYFDSHTSVLPFFHMLHSDLCARYASKSPRNGFCDDFLGVCDERTVDMKMTRWGRGVSYHDFELTLGENYGKHIIANGFEPEILQWFGVTEEEEILRYYLGKKGYTVPVAMTRAVLNFILCKTPVSDRGEKGAAVPALAIGDISGEKRLKECELLLQQKTLQLEEILHSKRWKIGSFIGSPYRLVKQLVLRKNI